MPSGISFSFQDKIFTTGCRRAPAFPDCRPPSAPVLIPGNARRAEVLREATAPSLSAARSVPSPVLHTKSVQRNGNEREAGIVVGCGVGADRRGGKRAGTPGPEGRVRREEG